MARGDVLANLAGGHLEPLGKQFVKQLSVDEMDLPEIGLRGVLGDSGAMLHRDPAMRIAFDAEAREQLDVWGGFLREPVLIA